MSENFVFPRGFVWGAACSAYQVEGAANEDGRGQSIWDTFVRQPGAVLNGDTGDTACDFYHRFADDLKLAQTLNLKAFRFSISWPRIFSSGNAVVNELGLDFYDRLVDFLLSVGIEPYITLYHWDLPQALQDKGGWANRDTAGYFADYAATVVHRLGDRVNKWMTINEPWCIAAKGNSIGEYAPGLKDKKVALIVGHHLLVAHGLAMQAIRSQKSDSEVGIATSLAPCEPESPDPADVEMANSHWEKNGRWFLDPLLRGHYPPIMYQLYGEDSLPVRPNDFALISQTMDFIGVNYYYRSVFNARGVVPKVAGSEYTDMGWEVNAPALKRMLVRMNEEYCLPPVFITENGCALPDQLTPSENVHDPRRMKFMHDHLAELREAMKQGVKVRGYFAWALTDNFEWQYGYAKRFGLIFVDYATQKRYIKDSAHWYARVIQRNELHK
jgi:beta-glucosidase